jgi:hypothetical protein
MLKVMIKMVIGRFLAGAVLLGSSAVLVITSAPSKSLTVQAQNAPIAYNDTWTATNLLTVNPLSSGHKDTNQIAVGVSAWRVTGSIPSTGVSFAEDWTVPSLPQFATTVTNDVQKCSPVPRAPNQPAGGLAPAICQSTGWLMGLWQFVPASTTGGNITNMAGVYLQSLSAKTFKPPSHSDVPFTVQDSFGTAGQAASCSNGSGGSGGAVGECLLATGPYAWQDVRLSDLVTTSGSPILSTYPTEPYVQGFAMPLQWSVAGTLCLSGTDQTACK